MAGAKATCRAAATAVFAKIYHQPWPQPQPLFPGLEEPESEELEPESDEEPASAVEPASDDESLLVSATWLEPESSLVVSLDEDEESLLDDELELLLEEDATLPVKRG